MEHSCIVCGKEQIGEIKEVKTKERRLWVPVWYCPACALLDPVNEKDRKEWADKYHWNTSSIMLGFEQSSYKCLGCNRVGSMDATTEYTAGGELFPITTQHIPCWCCAYCGFTDKARKEDRYVWAESFIYWASTY